MMPAVFVRQPRDVALRRCIGRFRKKKASSDLWKAFRKDDNCGARAIRNLQRAYGPRCLYCDHAYGWTIDHVAGKAATPGKRFLWANWRPACMDCNNKKGTARVVDPVRSDPRAYLVFDLATGAPVVVASGRALPIAVATRAVLDNQTLNDARRAARARMVDLLRAVANGQRGAKQRALELLQPVFPHRAILRDLILEKDDALNPYRDTVAAAVAALPQLERWAKSPTGR